MLPMGLTVERTTDVPSVARVMLDPRIVAETEPGFSVPCSKGLLEALLADPQHHFFGFRHEGEDDFRGVFPFLRVNEVRRRFTGTCSPSFAGTTTA